MWEWEAPEGWRVYDDHSQKALEACFRTYAGGLRMRVGWFAAVPGRQYTVHMPSRRYGGFFKQQNMTSGIHRKVRRDGEHQHQGYGQEVKGSLWDLGGDAEEGTAPPPPPDAPLPSVSSSSSSSALPRKWADPILKTQKSLDLSTAVALPVSILIEPFRWRQTEEGSEQDSKQAADEGGEKDGLIITAVSEPKDGSGGVIFIQTNKGVFVLKGSSTMAADLFANKLSAYKFPSLKMPTTRTIAYGSREMSDLAVRCLECIVKQKGEKVPYRPAKEWYLSHPLSELMRLAGSSGRIFGNNFLSLMQFIPQLEEKNMMSQNEVIRAARFEGLGVVVCLDLLTNNWDRLPLVQIWDHQGNLGNILFTEQGVVAIDNSVTAIKAERDKKKLKSYLKNVWTITSEVFHCHFTGKGNKISRCFEDVRKCLRDIHGFDIGNGCLVAMQAKFVASVQAAATLTLEELQTLLAEVKQHFVLTYTETTDESIGLNRVDLQFLLHVVRLVFEPLARASTWMTSSPEFVL